MITGAGVDIVEIARIERLYQRFGDRFLNRILTREELRPGLNPRRQVAYLARQFAAKEAVSKAIGTGMRQGVHFRNIIVLRNKAGAPVVQLTGDAATRLTETGATSIIVSLSDEKRYAIAYAVASR